MFLITFAFGFGFLPSVPYWIFNFILYYIVLIDNIKHLYLLCYLLYYFCDILAQGHLFILAISNII